MKSLRQVLTLALLAAPLGSGFAAVTVNTTLAVNITVNIDATVRIEWTNGTSVTTARTWALSNVDLNSAYTGAGVIANGTDSTNSLYVTNRTQVPADLAIGVSAETGWTHDVIANHIAANPNTYTIRASTSGASTVSTLNANGSVNAANSFTAGLELPAAAGTVQIANELAKDASQALDLEFITPVNVTANSATMTVTITGSVD